MKKLVFTLIILLVFIAAIAIGVFLIAPNLLNFSMAPVTPIEDQEPIVETAPPYTDIEIACVGDILPHQPVYTGAKSGAEYDFRPQFAYVKPLIEKADLAIANLETTLAGSAQKYSGYPMFNCPDEIVSALKDTGFDVLTNANNHVMDKGQTGFYRTIETVRASGLDLIGTRKTEEEKAYLIKNIKGVQFGLINFGYGSNTASGLQVNGLPMPASMQNLLNYLDYSRLGSEIKKLDTTIAAARSDGAQVIIVNMHWGNEYQTHSNALQQQVAQELAELKVDVVFGGHPHVLQEAAYVSAETSDHQTLVYYSLGNFLSNQRLETLSNINTEHGMIAQVTLRHHTDGRNEIINSGYTATWVNKKSSAIAAFEIIPANQALDKTADFPNIVNGDLTRLTSCQKNVDNLMVAIKVEGNSLPATGD